MNTTSVAGRTSDRFAKLSEADGEWLLTQHQSVIKLWIEASLADPFGESFKPLKSCLKETSFKRARLVLAEEGLFEFEPKCNRQDARKIDYWLVKNLHGSKMPYWTDALYTPPNGNQKSRFLETKEIAYQERHAFDQERHAFDQERHAFDQERHAFESETLSLSNFSASLDLNRINKISLDLANEVNENDSIDTRSGRLELDASTKVTASAPSPDAQLIENKSYAIPEDLSNTEAYSSSSKIKISTTANNLRGKQEEDLRSLKMMEGEVNKIGAKSAFASSVSVAAVLTQLEDSLSNRAEVTHDEAPPETLLKHSERSVEGEPCEQLEDSLPEAAKNAPTPNPVESSVEPPRPALKPRIGVIQHTPNEIMMEARAAYKSRGLDDKGMDGYWGAFQLALNKKMLATIAEGFAANEWELTTQIQSDLLSDYLLFVDKPYMFVRGKNELELTPWSQLPAIVGQKAN